MLSLFCVTTAVPESSFATIEFDQYWQHFNKSYSPGEVAHRREIFAMRKLAVADQNALYDAGVSTWWAAINNFSDWTDEEFARMRRGVLPHVSLAPVAFMSSSPRRDPNPPANNWRWAQTPVKNQKSCGSCWAFASTEVLESHAAIAAGKGSTPPVLAPQTLVSCVQNPKQCGGSGGCEGATAELAFNYSSVQGMATEADWPYAAHDTPCKAYTAAVINSGFVKLPRNDAAALETALATVGPVAVTVAANWMSYGGGIFSGGCKVPIRWKRDVCNLDHGVVAVGYTPDYWLIRNSWGAAWGEGGYIRLTRQNDNATFVDLDPRDGVACEPWPHYKNGTFKHQYPMGESGVLFDTAYPIGVRALNHLA